MTDTASTDPTINVLAAIVQGDRWLSADGVCVYLGLIKIKDGTPNRRRFLETVAPRPDFPKRHPIFGTWKKSEIDQWAESTRRSNRAA